MYSDRGLVLNGRPNTQLLKKLHWIIFATFVSINILHFPIVKVMSGTFQETISGKVCLLQTFTMVNEVSRKTFVGAQTFIFLVNSFTIFWAFRVGLKALGTLGGKNIPYLSMFCRFDSTLGKYVQTARCTALVSLK